MHSVWIPHTMTTNLADQRLDICSSLLSMKRHFRWLDNLVTGDEKWVLYANIAPKRQWIRQSKELIPTLKPELHPKKVMLSVWWDFKGVLYWELLPTNTTVTAEVYIAQLEKLKKSQIEIKPPVLKKYISESQNLFANLI